MKLTPCAQKALSQAKTSEDLFRALVNIREGSAFSALHELRINIDKLVPELEELIRNRRRPVKAPSARKILAIAEEEAVQMDHPQLTTGHLLIALMDESTPSTEQVLSEAGVKPEDLRKIMRKRKATKTMLAGLR